jgi:hypothetical protein
MSRRFALENASAKAPPPASLTAAHGLTSRASDTIKRRAAQAGLTSDFAGHFVRPGPSTGADGRPGRREAFGRPT